MCSQRFLVTELAYRRVGPAPTLSVARAPHVSPFATVLQNGHWCVPRSSPTTATDLLVTPRVDQWIASESAVAADTLEVRLHRSDWLPDLPHPHPSQTFIEEEGDAHAWSYIQGKPATNQLMPPTHLR